MHTCRRLRHFFFVAFFLCAVSCGSTTGRADYWPTDGWRSSPPEEQGLDPKILSEMDHDVKEPFPAVKGVLVVRNGYVVFENYYQGYDRSDYHHVFSVTKSVISAVVGIALKGDRIENLDQRLSEFFPEHFGPGTDARKRQITLENLLTMTSGFRPNSFYNNKGFEQILSSDDVVEASLGQPTAKEPGEEFNYNDGDAHLISAILTKTTGQSALAYAHENLFGPLGIDSDPDASIQAVPANRRRFEEAGFMWADDGQGNSVGAAGLKLTARDMANRLPLPPGWPLGGEADSAQGLRAGVDARAGADGLQSRRQSSRLRLPLVDEEGGGLPGFLRRRLWRAIHLRDPGTQPGGRDSLRVARERRDCPTVTRRVDRLRRGPGSRRRVKKLGFRGSPQPGRRGR